MVQQIKLSLAVKLAWTQSGQQGRAAQHKFKI